MKIFVANCSVQRHEFHYRILEQDRSRMLPIEAMSQIRLPDEFSKEQLDNLIFQHERYGFISVAEFKNGASRRKFTRLCYSIDVPISGVMIEAVFRGNTASLEELGKEIRKETAVASNQAVIRELDKQRRESGLEADALNFEQTIQEEEPRGGYDRPTADIVAEGFRIDQEAAPQQRGKRARG